MRLKTLGTGLGLLAIGVIAVRLLAQTNFSNGFVNIVQIAGNAVATAASGIIKVGVTDGTGTAITSTGAALDVNIKSGAIPSGSNIIGFVRTIPPGCSGQSTAAQLRQVGVANGAGSALTATTSCVVACYITNTSNSTVTIRLQDGQGTPVIWIGGNADFSIPANSNMRIGGDGFVFTSGVTAIAGTTNVLNIACPAYQ